MVFGLQKFIKNCYLQYASVRFTRNEFKPPWLNLGSVPCPWGMEHFVNSRPTWVWYGCVSGTFTCVQIGVLFAIAVQAWTQYQSQKGMIVPVSQHPAPTTVRPSRVVARLSHLVRLTSPQVLPQQCALPKCWPNLDPWPHIYPQNIWKIQETLWEHLGKYYFAYLNLLEIHKFPNCWRHRTPNISDVSFLISQFAVKKPFEIRTF